jgi:hypothetical protein
VSTPIDDAVEDLRGIDSPSASVVSVYLNLFPERLEKRSLLPRMRDLMHPLEALAQSGELDHDASQGLHADIQRVFELSDGLAMILDWRGRSSCRAESGTWPWPGPGPTCVPWRLFSTSIDG